MKSEAASSEYPKLRRPTRYYFGGLVELTDLESGRMIVEIDLIDRPRLEEYLAELERAENSVSSSESRP